MKWLSVICTRRVLASVRSECVCVCVCVCACLGEAFLSLSVPVCLNVMSIYFSVYSVQVCLSSAKEQAPASTDTCNWRREHCGNKRVVDSSCPLLLLIIVMIHITVIYCVLQRHIYIYILYIYTLYTYVYLKYRQGLPWSSGYFKEAKAQFGKTLKRKFIILTHFNSLLHEVL